MQLFTRVVGCGSGSGSVSWVWVSSNCINMTRYESDLGIWKERRNGAMSITQNVRHYAPDGTSQFQFVQYYHVIHINSVLYLTVAVFFVATSVGSSIIVSLSLSRTPESTESIPCHSMPK